jgi:hypothetical protein
VVPFGVLASDRSRPSSSSPSLSTPPADAGRGRMDELGSRQALWSIPARSMKAVISARPMPCLRLHITNGRFFRIFLASLSMTPSPLGTSIGDRSNGHSIGGQVKWSLGTGQMVKSHVQSIGDIQSIGDRSNGQIAWVHERIVDQVDLSPGPRELKGWVHATHARPLDQSSTTRHVPLRHRVLGTGQITRVR